MVFKVECGVEYGAPDQLNRVMNTEVLISTNGGLTQIYCPRQDQSKTLRGSRPTGRKERMMALDTKYSNLGARLSTCRSISFRDLTKDSIGTVL